MNYLTAPIVTSKGPRCMRIQDVLVHGPRVLNNRVRDMGRDVPGALHLANANSYPSVEAARTGFSLHTTPRFNRLTEPDIHTPYVRFGNPNTAELEAKLLYAHGLTETDNYEALTYGSGMGAIFAALISCTKPGDEIIMDAPKHLYGCTGRLGKIMERVFGRKVTFVDMEDSLEGNKRLQATITPKTKAIYVEAETNPSLKLNNIARLATIANEVNQAEKRDPASKIHLVVDNTFLGPLFCRPLELAREAVPSDPELLIVVESLTKILGGFGLDMGGAVIAPRDLIHDHNWEDEGLIAMRDMVGSILSPYHAFHFSDYSLPTYIDRAKTAEQIAVRFAQYLETVQGKYISSVTYPGLPSFPQNDLAGKMLRDYDGIRSTGFMIGFNFMGDLATQEKVAVRFMDFIAQNGYAWNFMVSLGQVRSLTEVPAAMTHYGSGMPMFARNSIGTESPVTLTEEADSAFQYAYANAA